MFNKLLEDIKISIKKSENIEEIEKIRIQYLGKKGILSNHMKKLKFLDVDKKKECSIILNHIKNKIIIIINQKKIFLKEKLLNQRILNEKIDISLPGRRIENGFLHPITHTINDIKHFFYQLGFTTIYGPEIEDEYHNFDALNIDKNHPARDSHDTFWFDSNRLLRTQTSSMQIRAMNQDHPPMRLLVPGKVYRNDYDITHTPMFHQIEGLIVDKNINFSHLKWIIYHFLYYFFDKNISIRFRPSYFPFTVLSAEVDVIDQNGVILEILGCGIVHPKVLQNVNIDSNVYSACAFGLGIERMTMIRYGISDIRSFFENDMRFLAQFKYI
ncbi:phenylalanine--tRNA ligase subunit alpha [Buchnera aphidicola]|uniref:phenylalanine--tRNA ligase subunit alpha n=1 Tax=Buchnera aphidicola TaxID=9 RepID=UPI003BEEDFD4